MILNIPNRDILLLTEDFNEMTGNNNIGLSKIMEIHEKGAKKHNGDHFIEFCQYF